MRRFRVTITADVDIDEAVFAAVTEEWRGFFYALETDSEVAAMVGAAAVRGTRLSQMDGWANLPDELVQVGEADVEADEVKP